MPLCGAQEFQGCLRPQNHMGCSLFLPTSPATVQVQMGSWTWYIGTLSHGASYLWERCHHSGGLPSGQMLQEVPGQPGLLGEDIAKKLHHWLQLPWATQHQALTLLGSLRTEAPQGVAWYGSMPQIGPRGVGLGRTLTSHPGPSPYSKRAVGWAPEN